MGPPLSVEWFGTTTFRIRVDGLTLWFDTYLDRVPGLDPVGLSAAAVDEADFVFVSHAHFDHLYGADTIAAATGATVVGSYESARLLRANGIPETQLIPVAGGETIDCGRGDRGRGVTVRVLPAQHSCLFAGSDPDSGVACLGDLGVFHQERVGRAQALFELIAAAPEPVSTYLAATDAHASRHDGGQLAYLLQTSQGSILVSASAGYWSGIFAGLQPDVALLSLGGRPNVDGEPYQGSSAAFMLEQVERLQPGRVAFCHHDPLVPGLPGVDVGPAAALLRDRADRAGYLELSYNSPFPILGG